MLPLNEILKILGYADSSHFRTKERQFEPESVHHFRLAKDRQSEKFSVKGLYVFDTGKGAAISLAARPAVCVAAAPSIVDAKRLHRRIWNLGNVPFLIVRLPDQVRVYSGFLYDETGQEGLIIEEKSEAEATLLASLSDFTADSIDSARIWQAQRQRLDTRHRVDTKLLENLKNLAQALAKHCTPVLDLPTAHALIGKFVYLRYLRDRNILDDKWLSKRQIMLEQVFGPHATVAELSRLVDALEDRFNGDVFHLDLGPTTLVDDSHVRLVATVFSGDEIHEDETGFVLQLHLAFQRYDFRHIPVETLSSIYEQFLHAQIEAKSEGAFYTPEVLADYLISEINSVRQLEPGMTILDPSCGSGIFLVLAYRRLIELELDASNKRPGEIDPERLREILLNSIYGVERQRDACNVTTFSLILTLLNYVDPPALHANEHFKFPNLIKKRIFCDDFFNPDLKLPIPKGGFDLVVGNPPWIELKPATKGEDHARAWISSAKLIAGNRVADAFAVKAGRLLSRQGVAGLLLPATTLFTLEGKHFRQKFFTEFLAARVTNLANLRGNLFGGRAFLPTTTLVFQKRNDESEIKPIIHYGPFAVNQVAGNADMLWVLTIHGTEIQQIPQSQAATGETSVWKLALWGTNRDAKALDRIRQIYPLSLTGFCEQRNWGKKLPREGAQLRHKDSEEEIIRCPELKRKKRFDPSKFNQFVKGGLHFSLPPQALVPIPDDWCYIRKRGGDSGLAINHPPHLMIPDAWKNFLIFSEEYFAIPPRKMGISCAPKDGDVLRALAVYLGSSFVDYYLFFHVPHWGVYSDMPIVVQRAVRSIPTPNFTSDQIATLAKAHRQLLKQESGFRLESDVDTITAEKQQFIDLTVFESLSVPDDLRIIIEDFRDTRLPLDQGQSALRKLVKHPSVRELQAYGRSLRDELDNFLLGEAHALVNIFTSPDLIHCELKLNSGTARDKHAVAVVDIASNSAINRSHRVLRERLSERFSQWSYVDRNLRVFEESAIQLFKSPRLMDWTRTQALNDADDIIAEILTSGEPTT